jgi:DNA-directed RNA polymerase subunit N (RpoN/RPB10)
MRICPTCGETCAHDWCGFCERVLDESPTLPRMESAEILAALGAQRIGRRCAFEKCDDPGCYYCAVMPRLFHVDACGRMVEAGKKGLMPCRLVRRHHGPCKPSTRRQAADKEDEWGIR